ncbi:hypothetical protein H5410_050073 [Solanum commersonii]|uniref:Uncharacterized protein n=1 Tax=Solanum commersonii TaxID=4109 RepID=A0A9J5WWX5_SOLCO|nr:hypothetical protein H5410_050073 [Solanum commersonii]
MNEFFLLCEHLYACPKRNSNPKGNFNPNKIVGDVPLAPSAKNISLVSTDMPKPKSKDKGKSRAESKDAISSKEEKRTTSSKDEKTISRKPDNNTNKVEKQHPKEEEYLAFTRQIYNLPEESGETFGTLPLQKIDNQKSSASHSKIDKTGVRSPKNVEKATVSTKGIASPNTR